MVEHNGPSRYGEEVSIYVRDRPVTEADLAAENQIISGCVWRKIQHHLRTECISGEIRVTGPRIV